LRILQLEHLAEGEANRVDGSSGSFSEEVLKFDKDLLDAAAR
jgi:hypothetical protein